MSEMGLLDLPAPLLSGLDGILAMAIPPLARIWLYGMLAGWICMWLYRRYSAQTELAEVSALAQQIRKQLATYDGPFDGLLRHVRALLHLSLRQLRLSFVPALLSGIPVLFLLPWLSNHFGVVMPAAGEPVRLTPRGFEVPIDSLHWSKADRVLLDSWDPLSKSWTLAWPTSDQPVMLRHQQQTLLSLPLSTGVEIVHQRSLPLNLLIANPAGYLPVDSPVHAIELDLQERHLHTFGYEWMRGWLAMFLLPVVVASLFLRWRWKLQ